MGLISNYLNDLFHPRRNARTAALESLSYDLGMTFNHRDTHFLIEMLQDFNLFKFKGRVYNVFHQQDQWNNEEFFIFDYKYTVSTGKSSVTYKQTVFFIDSKELELPEFWMKPEKWFHKLGALIGLSDINFDTHPEFSYDYHLKGKDQEYVRKQFNEKVLNYFTVEKDWYLEGIGYYLIFYKHNYVLKPNLLKDFQQKAMNILQLLTKNSDKPE